MTKKIFSTEIVRRPVIPEPEPHSGAADSTEEVINDENFNRTANTDFTINLLPKDKSLMHDEIIRDESIKQDFERRHILLHSTPVKRRKGTSVSKSTDPMPEEYSEGGTSYETAESDEEGTSEYVWPPTETDVIVDSELAEHMVTPEDTVSNMVAKDMLNIKKRIQTIGQKQLNVSYDENTIANMLLEKEKEIASDMGKRKIASITGSQQAEENQTGLRRSVRKAIVREPWQYNKECK